MMMAMGSLSLYPMGYYELLPKFKCTENKTPPNW